MNEPKQRNDKIDKDKWVADNKQQGYANQLLGLQNPSGNMQARVEEAVTIKPRLILELLFSHCEGKETPKTLG